MEIIFYIVYMAAVIVVSLLLNKLAFYFDDCRLRKKEMGLEYESGVYKNFLEEFEKNKSYKYCEETIQNYKNCLDVDKEVLLHTRRVIQSDLEKIAIDSIIYGIIMSAMALFFSLISTAIVSVVPDNFGNISSDVINSLLLIYLSILIFKQLNKSMKAFRNKKYFVYLIEDVIEENESNKEIEIQNLKAQVEELEKKIKHLKKGKKSK